MRAHTCRSERGEAEGGDPGAAAADHGGGGPARRRGERGAGDGGVWGRGEKGLGLAMRGISG